MSALQSSEQWPTVQLSDVISEDRGICYGIVQPGEALETGVPIVRVNNVKGGRVDPEGLMLVSPEVEAQYQRSRLRGGEVLITLVGTVGELAIVTPEMKGWNVARAVGVIPVRSDVGSHWIKYCLASGLAQTHIESRVNTTVQTTLNLRDLSALRIPLPDRSERASILNVLSSLDDKIELNRRMNETLEAMARAIFKDWFVDFGPVRAKMEGGDPRGLAPEVASLFPHKMGDDGLPEGWGAAPISQVISFNPGERLHSGATAPYLDMAALPTSGSWPAEPISRAFTSGTRFRSGDTLLARITPCLENGKAAYIQGLDGIGWGSTEFIVMRSKLDVPRCYTYLFARDPVFKAHAIRSMTGSSGRQRVQVESLSTFAIAMPSPGVFRAFGSVVEPWFDMIASNSRQSSTLASVRDLLLPKLMSGEIHIRNAEKLVGQTAA